MGAATGGMQALAKTSIGGGGQQQAKQLSSSLRHTACQRSTGSSSLSSKHKPLSLLAYSAHSGLVACSHVMTHQDKVQLKVEVIAIRLGRGNHG